MNYVGQTFQDIIVDEQQIRKIVVFLEDSCFLLRENGSTLSPSFTKLVSPKFPGLSSQQMYHMPMLDLMSEEGPVGVPEYRYSHDNVDSYIHMCKFTCRYESLCLTAVDKSRESMQTCIWFNVGTNYIMLTLILGQPGCSLFMYALNWYNVGIKST